MVFISFAFVVQIFKVRLWREHASQAQDLDLEQVYSIQQTFALLSPTIQSTWCLLL